MYIYIYVYIYACIYMYTYMRVCVFVCIYVYIHIYIYAYIYIYHSVWASHVPESCPERVAPLCRHTLVEKKDMRKTKLTLSAIREERHGETKTHVKNSRYQLSGSCDRIKQGIRQMRRDSCQRNKSTSETLSFKIRQRTQLSMCWLCKPAARTELEKDFPKCTVDLKKGLNWTFSLATKISFVGVAYLRRGGRSCSWVLYRSVPCTIVGSYRDRIGQPNKKQRIVKISRQTKKEAEIKSNAD